MGVNSMNNKLFAFLAFFCGLCLCSSETPGVTAGHQAPQDIVFQIPEDFKRDLLEFTGTKSIVEISSAVFVQTHEYKVYGVRVVLEHFPDLQRDIAEGVMITDVAYVIRPGEKAQIYYLMVPLSHLLNPNGINFEAGFKRR